MALIGNSNNPNVKSISIDATQLGNGIGVEFRERDVLLIALCRQIAPDGRTLTPAGAPMFASHSEALELIRRGAASLKQLPTLTPADPVVQAASIQPVIEPEVVVIHASEVLEDLVVDNPELEGVLTKAFEAADAQVSEPVVGTKRAYNRKVKATET